MKLAETGQTVVPSTLQTVAMRGYGYNVFVHPNGGISFGRESGRRQQPHGALKYP